MPYTREQGKKGGDKLLSQEGYNEGEKRIFELLEATVK